MATNLLRTEVDLITTKAWSDLTIAEQRQIAIKVLQLRGDPRSLQVADYVRRSLPQFSDISVTESA